MDKMTDKAKILFHVGYHKTATSLLQERFFSNESHGFFSEPSERNDIIEAFVAPDPLQGADQEKMQKLQHKPECVRGNQVMVFSHERLAGYPASAGIDQEIIARRIKECFPRSKVMMVVREQKDMIKSMYFQYVFDGGALSLDRYLSGVERKLFRSPQFSYGYYDYAAALRMYQECFGAKNVLCLPYEMLRREPGSFLNSITDFCGLERISDSEVAEISSSRVNSKKSYVELSLRRLTNKLFRTQLSNYGFEVVSNAQLAAGFRLLSGFFPTWRVFEKYQDQRMESFISEKVKNRYAKNNLELSGLTGIDFGQYGYDVDSKQ